MRTVLLRVPIQLSFDFLYLRIIEKRNPDRNQVKNLQ